MFEFLGFYWNVEILLNRGANPVALDNYRNAPISLAAACKNPESVRLLCQNGTTTLRTLNFEERKLID